MNEINEEIRDSKITTNTDRVFFEEPYGIYLREGFKNTTEVFELNWLYNLILFLVYTNRKNDADTTVKDVMYFFDTSRIFYLQKNPIPQKYEVEQIVLDLLLRLAAEQCILFQNPVDNNAPIL